MIQRLISNSALQGVVNVHLYAVADELQLPPAARARAEEIYHHVGKYLQTEAKSFASTSAEMYAQGSMRLHTTTHPLQRDVFDLDAVSELGIDFRYLDPIRLINGMHNELIGWQKKYGAFFNAKPPVRKNRCTQLEFTGEIFTVDVVSAARDTSKPAGFIKIPDRNLQDFKDTNPKGLGIWYDGRCATQMQIKEAADARAMSSVEPLRPDQPTARKPVLTLVTQLTKRARDRFHREHPELATPSILLTVIMAQGYAGDFDLATALLRASENLLAIAAQHQPPEVRNPANADEIISEKWQQPEVWASFQRFAQDFHQRVVAILEQENLQRLRVLLQDTFGERVVAGAVGKLSRAIDDAHQRGRQAVTSTGRVTAACVAAGLTVPAYASPSAHIVARPTTYHGD